MIHMTDIIKTNSFILNEMMNGQKIIKMTRQLVAKTRTGKDKHWQGIATQEGDRFFTSSCFFQTNKDGESSKIQFSERYEVFSKNVGKANEILAKNQVLLELTRMEQKQIDSGYAPHGEESKILPLPMLANKFTDRGDKLTYSVYCQPKYNGNRCLFQNGTAWSRKGKYMIPEVIQHLTIDTQGHILDGELMLPGNVLLQESMTAIKKYRPELSPKLLYHVYDVVIPDKTFGERYKVLKKIFQSNINSSVLLVPTFVANNEEEVLEFHKQFVEQGFEGTMIRDDSEGYRIGYRSNQLLKLKDFQDAEWKIVGIEEGLGKFVGTPIFVCETKDGNQFNCTPNGTMEYRKELWANRKNLINKYLTIQYQELSKENIPLFPVGIDIRDDN